MTSLANRRSTPKSARISINWPLWLGVLLIGAIAYLAVSGPELASKDPLEENLIVRDETTGEWYIPPFPAFTVTGFPLGSDEFGRDLFSRLLFAVRPTFQMVLVVAFVRLVLGTLIGLVAGYSSGRIGGFFDSLITSALALPGLLVALGAIAVIGPELGVLAFVIGLSLTGWAETARLVREQTRTIRGEVYVEAAHALGATDSQIVFQHVVRQIRAMLLMLLAFEVGSTLMLTAGLGFLGYYIGGDVWVDVDDFVARRTSGSPELGQMLATAWVRLTDPWGLVAVGSVVFAAVLGFNLIGEGLRLRVSPEIQVLRVRWLSELSGRLRMSVAEVLYPVNRLLFGSRIAVVFWVFLFSTLAGYGLVTGWQAGLFDLGEPQVNLLFEEPEAAPTATSAGTAAGGSGAGEGSEDSQDIISAEPLGETVFVEGGDFQLPTDPVRLTDPVTAWTFKEETGFERGPTVDPEGNIYITSRGGTLYALQADGTLHWQQDLDPAPAYSPEIGPDGNLYITDRAGGAAALDPDGTVLWQFTQSEGLSAASPMHFGPDGSLYYSVSRGANGGIQALNPDGELRWQAPVQAVNFLRRPSTSAAGDLVFLRGEAFSTDTGEPVPLEIPVEPEWFFVGEDGKDYLVYGNTVSQWERLGDTVELVTTVRAFGVAEQSTGSVTPQDIFVTPEGDVLFFFRGFMLWENPAGELRNYASAPNGHFLTVAAAPDDTQTTISCGQFRYSTQDPLTEFCMGLSPESEEPVWRVTFGSNTESMESVTGAAPTPTGFVVASRSGELYAVMERPIAEALAEWQSQADLQGTAITATGSGWIFTSPEDLLVSPIVHSSGSVYLLTTGQRIFVLDGSGATTHVLPLPEPVYVLEDAQFAGGTFQIPFTPVIGPDGSTLIVTAAQRVYALTLEGEQLWEFPLDASPHAPPAREPGSDRYFQIDSSGALYAFSSAEGLIWKHDIDDGMRPTAPFPAFGPEGNIYYLITFGARGEVEAVSPDGEPLWRTRLGTFRFFEPIHIAPSGEWLVIDDDILRTENGELVELADLEFSIDQVAIGMDDKTYLLSGNTVMEWSLLPGGRLNVARQVTVADPPNVTRGVPPELSVSGDGTIQIMFFRAGGRAAVFDWVDFDGNVLNQISVNFSSDFIVERDLESLSLTVCSLSREESQLVCRKYDPSTQEPRWELTIKGIPRADSIQYRGGVLYIQTRLNNLQTVEVTFPQEGQ